MAINIAIVGLGMIARNHHLPNILANPNYKLRAIVEPTINKHESLPVYHSQAALFAAHPEVQAVALCTPPRIRMQLAVEALRAGCHVLLEKPPAETMAEFEMIKDEANLSGKSLFATWHSQYNEAVFKCRDLLAQKIQSGGHVTSLFVHWKENVGVHHPGQDWLFAQGGFGVFDHGINAFSVLRAILPQKIWIKAATLETPMNRDCSIRGLIHVGLQGSPGQYDQIDDAFRIELENLYEASGPCWEITLTTNDGTKFKLFESASRLRVNDQEVPVTHYPHLTHEYKLIYQRFYELINKGQSDIDAWPLQFCADACLMAKHVDAPDYHWPTTPPYIFP